MLSLEIIFFQYVCPLMGAIFANLMFSGKLRLRSTAYSIMVIQSLLIWLFRRHYFVLSTNYSSAPIRDVHNVREYLLQLCRKKISLFALNCHRLPSLRLGTTYFTGGKAGVAWWLKSNSLGCHDGELHRMDCVFIPIEGNQIILY